MKKRLDMFLYEKGFYSSRQKSKQAIETGRVFVNGKVVEKASIEVEDNVKIEAKPFEFVSRGGYKLQKAIEEFSIDLTDKVVLDIGASTGGFSDVCLKNGARKIYAVDTGEGQLAEMIKNNPKVLDMSKTNFLTLEKEKITDVDFVVIDVSFVSLTKLIPVLASDFDKVKIVALIKPQFECGLEYARKHKGIVKDEKMHEKIIKNIAENFEKYGFKNNGIIVSPIKGGDGNTEFLIFVEK